MKINNPKELFIFLKAKRLKTKRSQADIVYSFLDKLIPNSSILRQRIQFRFKISSLHTFDLVDLMGAVL